MRKLLLVNTRIFGSSHVTSKIPLTPKGGIFREENFLRYLDWCYCCVVSLVFNVFTKIDFFWYDKHILSKVARKRNTGQISVIYSGYIYVTSFAFKQDIIWWKVKSSPWLGQVGIIKITITVTFKLLKPRVP